MGVKYYIIILSRNYIIKIGDIERYIVFEKISFYLH